MVINLIILIIIGFISCKIGKKSFLDKKELKSISKWTKIIFQISFVLSNLIITFIILYILLPLNQYDIILWKSFLIFVSFFFFYFLPFYLLYNLYDANKKVEKYKIFCIYIFYLISSNILYRFFNRTYEKSIFEINFYYNYSNILEYLAFLLDIFNGANFAYTSVNNISSFLIYPLLKKRKFIYDTDSSIKKNLEEINHKIFEEEAKLNELNLEKNELIKNFGQKKNNNNKDKDNDNFTNRAKIVSETRQNVEKKLQELKNIKLSYEFKLNIITQKENKIKQKDIITIIINIIKIFQGFIFLFSGAIRAFSMDYSYYNYPINLEEKSSIYELLKSPYLFIHFSDWFIILVEQVYSLIIIFMLFLFNLSASEDRILVCISYAFSYLKENKNKYYDAQILLFSIFAFSYYLVCGLLIVNSMKFINFRDRLYRYLFPGFDFENLHWYYDCSYVLAASCFIVKEIVEYSNISSQKKNIIKKEKSEKMMLSDIYKPEETHIQETDKKIKKETDYEDDDHSQINRGRELENDKVMINMDFVPINNEDNTQKETEEMEEINKKNLIDELIEKDNLLQMLIKSNNELTTKIEYSNKRYENIISKIEKQEQEKNDILSQIKQIEEEISDYNIENEKYKKMIEQLKNKIEIKNFLEKDSNLKNILQKEMDKNKELKVKLTSIKSVNNAQLKYLNDYDKVNHMSEKIEFFKSEIDQIKNTIKESQEKCIKIEKFNNIIHERIISIEMLVKKIKEKNQQVEEKTFKEEELHDTIDTISILKDQINAKRNEMNNLYKSNNEKLYKLLTQNKTVELEIKDNLRINKLLIFKRNELRRIIKAMISKK